MWEGLLSACPLHHAGPLEIWYACRVASDLIQLNLTDQETDRGRSRQLWADDARLDSGHIRASGGSGTINAHRTTDRPRCRRSRCDAAFPFLIQANFRMTDPPRTPQRMRRRDAVESSIPITPRGPRMYQSRSGWRPSSRKRLNTFQNRALCSLPRASRPGGGPVWSIISRFD